MGIGRNYANNISKKIQYAAQSLNMTSALRRACLGTMSISAVRVTAHKPYIRYSRLLICKKAIIQNLENLHNMLIEYVPPKVIMPTIESLQPKRSFLGSFFGGDPSYRVNLSIPKNLPKGLYMYGDVGSGKTMLMDLFYDTLPPNVTYKKRIHFHNFMQDVHKDLHKMKIAHGNDIDAVPFVAARIAERSTVLCFDEFQCTDVADAMILRRYVDSLSIFGITH